MQQRKNYMLRKLKKAQENGLTRIAEEPNNIKTKHRKTFQKSSKLSKNAKFQDREKQNQILEAHREQNKESKQIKVKFEKCTEKASEAVKIQELTEKAAEFHRHKKQKTPIKLQSSICQQEGFIGKTSKVDTQLSKGKRKANQCTYPYFTLPLINNNFFFVALVEEIVLESNYNKLKSKYLFRYLVTSMEDVGCRVTLVELKFVCSVCTWNVVGNSVTGV